MATDTSSLIDDLPTLVRHARQTLGGGDGLWPALVRVAGPRWTTLQLTQALAARYRVHPPAQSLTPASDAPGLVRGPDGHKVVGVWVQRQDATDTPTLLCADPWDSAALMALGRRPGAHAILAQSGQIEALCGAAKSGPSTAHGAVAGAPAGTLPVQDASGVPVVIQFVDAAILKAYTEGASDIHFETSRAGVSLKFRIDGVMLAGEQLGDASRAEEVISRIKVLAQLDITERRRPQDGRIHWQGASGAQHPIDLRVSIMPSIFGEDAVLRLLDKTRLRDSEADVSLDSLGFDAVLAARIRSLASRPHGMLLVTGPTGSGKTTTVYAALSEINDGLEKIITIEDPVEYELAGVLQIPVNEQKGLTFATGLRSILRHDPDRILVGEIRDAETAEIAVQSSLTGHLVMTTVHANSLFDVLGRFQHFGIDPFGLASALNGIVVQRLLRKLCQHCMAWRQPDTAECGFFAAQGLAEPSRLPRPMGCPHCRNSGYKGRLVVAEVHELTDAHRDLIVRKASLSDMRVAMYQAAGADLLSQALCRASEGATSMEEIRRVVGLA
jgi:general secretion pathway protein E